MHWRILNLDSTHRCVATKAEAPPETQATFVVPCWCDSAVEPDPNAARCVRLMDDLYRAQRENAQREEETCGH